MIRKERVSLTMTHEEVLKAREGLNEIERLEDPERYVVQSFLKELYKEGYSLSVPWGTGIVAGRDLEHSTLHIAPKSTILRKISSLSLLVRIRPKLSVKLAEAHLLAQDMQGYYEKKLPSGMIYHFHETFPSVNEDNRSARKSLKKGYFFSLDSLGK
ncbi:MAG: hypothetical protein WCK90_04625 [archaeon]